jgi:hypothetical protein
MTRVPFAFVLFVASRGLCRTPEKPDALQSLFIEVLQLRQDIEAMTIASQRVQMALHASQIQDASVARATLRLDDVRSRCVKLVAERDKLTSEVQADETILASGSLLEQDAKQVKLQISEGKRSIETKSGEMQGTKQRRLKYQGSCEVSRQS